MRIIEALVVGLLSLLATCATGGMVLRILCDGLTGLITGNYLATLAVMPFEGLFWLVLLLLQIWITERAQLFWRETGLTAWATSHLMPIFDRWPMTTIGSVTLTGMALSGLVFGTARPGVLSELADVAIICLPILVFIDNSYSWYQRSSNKR